MILGYILSDEGGTPIIYKELVKIFEGSGGTIFSSLLSALSSALEELTRSRLDYFQSAGTHVYIGYGNGLILSLISDTEDPQLKDLVDYIMDRINGLVSSSEDLTLNEDLRNIVDEEIMKVIYRSPPSIRSVRQLANALYTLIDLEHGDELKVRNLKVIKYKPSFIDRLKKSVQKISLEKLVELYYAGDLEAVVNFADSLFDDPELGDLAKILYSKAALTLNSFDPRIKAPDLGEVNAVISSIKDELAKTFLKAELMAFFDLGSYNERREFFIRKRFDFLQKLSQDGIVSDVYAILIAPVPNKQVLGFLERKFKEKSEWLYIMCLEMDYLLDVLVRRPKDITEFLSLLGDIKAMLDNSLKRDLPSKYSLSHMYMFILIWGLLTPNLKFEEGKDLLYRVFDYVSNNFDLLLEKAFRATNRHKGVNLYFIFNLIYGLLLELEDVEAINRIEKFYNYIKDKLEWLVGVKNANRIMVDMYYVTLAGLIAAITRVAEYRRTFFKDLPKLLVELSDDNMMDFWEQNEYHFIHYYIDLLEAIGNTVLLSSYKEIKRNILSQVAYGIERAAKMMQHSPMLYYFKILLAVKFYALSGVDENIKRAKEIIDEIRTSTNDFIYYIAKKILQKYVRDEGSE